MNDLFSLQGRVALVTGGSRGIGRMIAKGFLAQGARVYISSRKADVCEATAKELSQDGGKCVPLPVDVSTSEGVAALAAAYGRHESKLDILVNNAGAAWLAEFDAFPEKGWDKVVDLNLKTPFFLTQALVGSLRAAARPERPAKVINIASVDGVSVNPQETYSYAASKSGLIHLTRRMALRLAPENIVVSAIAPGAFATVAEQADKLCGGDFNLALEPGDVFFEHLADLVQLRLGPRIFAWSHRQRLHIDGLGITYWVFRVNRFHRV